MDVTKTNFKKLLPEILGAIDSSSFLAVDGEFTGLTNGHNVTAFDTPNQYYDKIRSGALDFLFIQFGLSIFKQVKGNERYENKTYVFYLFPQPLNRDVPDCRFLCQASSLSFLAQNGFNFNKLFKEGIPYLKQCDEETLREAMADRSRYKAANASTNSSIPIPKQYQQFVNQAMEKIKELLSPNCKKEEVHIEKCSAFVRKLVYQTVREQLDGKNIIVETKNGVLVARKGVSPEQLDKEKQDKAEKEEETIQEAIGFATIIRHLATSQKLIVGHNILLDICHMVHRFIEPLPEDYFEFKEMLHSIFPKILDTKYLVSEGPFSDLIPSSHLQGVVESISKSPFEVPKIDSENDYSYVLQNEKFHDAGYDAFVTGISFLTMLRYLDKNKKGKSPAEAPVIQKYLNKLFLMRTPDTFIDLERQDPEPTRDHVFHVTFPKSWTSQNLIELFSPFGSIQIKWLSDTTAWVGLLDKESASKVTLALENKPVSRNPEVIVKGYTRYTSRTGIAASSPRPNKRKSASSIGNSVATGNSTHPSAPSLKGEGDTISKKRKSSMTEHNIGTILEEVENNRPEETLKNLASTVGSADGLATFPVDQDWG